MADFRGAGHALLPGPHGGQGRAGRAGRAVPGKRELLAWAASCTCCRRKPRTTSLSSSTISFCISARPGAAWHVAAARTIVSPGTFTL